MKSFVVTFGLLMAMMKAEADHSPHPVHKPTTFFNIHHPNNIKPTPSKPPKQRPQYNPSAPMKSEYPTESRVAYPPSEPQYNPPVPHYTSQPLYPESQLPGVPHGRIVLGGQCQFSAPNSYPQVVDYRLNPAYNRPQPLAYQVLPPVAPPQYYHPYQPPVYQTVQSIPLYKPTEATKARKYIAIPVIKMKT